MVPAEFEHAPGIWKSLAIEERHHSDNLFVRLYVFPPLVISCVERVGEGGGITGLVDLVMSRHGFADQVLIGKFKWPDLAQHEPGTVDGGDGARLG